MKRIYHTWDKWECYPAGFYAEKDPGGRTKQEAEEEYAKFLEHPSYFSAGCQTVIYQWRHSCEHYLTNEKMNRIAWMGQAAACAERGLPACFRGGYNLLCDRSKVAADYTALKYINEWMIMNDYETLTMDQIQSKTVANLY